MSRVWPFRVTWCHRSRDHWIPHRSFSHFLLVVLWNQASISNRFKDIQWQMWRSGWHDLKRPLYKGQGHSFGTNRFLIYDFL